MREALLHAVARAMLDGRSAQVEAVGLDRGARRRRRAALDEVCVGHVVEQLRDPRKHLTARSI